MHRLILPIPAPTNHARKPPRIAIRDASDFHSRRTLAVSFNQVPAK